MELNQKERELLRGLASRYMEIASLPVQGETCALWKALNRGQMARPMVVMDQLPWHELAVDDSLQCVVRDPFWREIEWNLRMTLYRWAHFPVDLVVEPVLTIPRAVTCTGYGITVDETTRATEAANDVVSHAFVNQLEEEEDVAKIQDMHFTHDAAESARRLAEAEAVFEGICPVRLGGWQFHLGVWDKISELMSVEDVYYEMMDRPEFLHQIMERITQATLNGIAEANALGIHDDQINTCHCSYIYTDELLPAWGGGKGSQSKNCWAFGLAQLFTSVSPAGWEEFELPYISRMAEQFGMIYYGCCERLDDRLELVKRIPNLRKVSCSPWSQREAFAEKIGHTLVMSNKPTPALLAVDAMDEDEVRRDLRRTIEAARTHGANLELILKDVSTVRHDPSRLDRWAKIAMEEVCR